jgi:hypothetical protein
MKSFWHAINQVILIFIASGSRFAISYEVLDDKFLIVRVFGREFGRVPINEIIELRDSSIFEAIDLNVANLSNTFIARTTMYVLSKNNDFLYKFLISPNNYEREALIRLFQSNSGIFNK